MITSSLPFFGSLDQIQQYLNFLEKRHKNKTNWNPSATTCTTNIASPQERRLLWRWALLSFPLHFDIRTILYPVSRSRSGQARDHSCQRGVNASVYQGHQAPPGHDCQRLWRLHAVEHPREQSQSPARRTVRSTAVEAHRGRMPQPPYLQTRVSSHMKQPHDVPLGSLLIWLRCSSPQSLSRHTPPPGTSYEHTRRSVLRLVNCASERCSTASFNGLRSGRGIGGEE